MKKTVALLITLLALLLTSRAAFAAGTVTFTSRANVPGSTVHVYTYTLTADAAAATFPATSTAPINIDGWIIGVETDPGAVAPTALWDLTLVDANGADVMASACLNRSATATERVISPQPYVYGPVTITAINNSVNSAVVVLKITVLR